jgi:hypothetical protein
MPEPGPAGDIGQRLAREPAGDRTFEAGRLLGFHRFLVKSRTAPTEIGPEAQGLAARIGKARSPQPIGARFQEALERESDLRHR